MAYLSAQAERTSPAAAHCSPRAIALGMIAATSIPAWRGSLLDGGEHLASKLTAQLLEQLGVRYRAIARWQRLAVEDLLAVQQDLQRAALTAWSEGNRYFGVPAPGD